MEIIQRSANNFITSVQCEKLVANDFVGAEV